MGIIEELKNQKFDDENEPKNREFQILEHYGEEKIKDHQLRILTKEKEMLDNNI